MAQEIVDLCAQAAELNYSAKFRKGNILELPAKGKLIVTGDLHGHRRNFGKIVTFADLENNPDTFLVLQEILHGGPEDEFGGDLSFELFFDILRFQIQHPHQVFLIFGNHDTAIINDSDVLKAGKEMNEAMKNAMKRQYSGNYHLVMDALRKYLMSQFLAVRTPNRIWMSHSLPADRYVEEFDTGVFQKQLKQNDFERLKPVYLLTWGRRHSNVAIQKLCRLFDVDIFILGHQPQESGFAHTQENLIILASDHNHGCLIPIDLAQSYSAVDLVGSIVPLASIA